LQEQNKNEFVLSQFEKKKITKNGMQKVKIFEN